MNSTSGYTLHRKACKKIGVNVKAAAQFKPKMAVSYRLKATKIIHIKDGLVLLANGELAAASKIVTRQKPGIKRKKVGPAEPKNAVEWVGYYCDKYSKESKARQRAMIMVLYRHTSHAKYHGWKEEDIKEALDKRLGKK